MALSCTRPGFFYLFHPAIAFSMTDQMVSKKQNVVYMILTVLVSIYGVGMLYVSRRGPETWPRPLEQEPFNAVPSNPDTPFLYLIQTESCIPDEFKKVEIMGKQSSCRCEVLILSFKEVCGITPPSHIEYIFANGSTSWASGRNMLFEEAKKRKKKYLFYIFTDDDIVLKNRPKKKLPKRNNWRVFENFLLQVQPAIGAVDASNNPMLKEVLKGRKKRGCLLKKPGTYLPSPRYDPAFYAFHYEAIELLLPYPDQFDNISWYYAELQMEVKCEVMFAGQSILHTEMLAGNPKHRPYTKKLPTLEEWEFLVDAVEDVLPDQYKNSSLLLEWRKNGLEQASRSPTVCLPPPPPEMPIIPFAYLDGSLS